MPQQQFNNNINLFNTTTVMSWINNNKIYDIYDTYKTLPPQHSTFVQRNNKQMKEIITSK